MKVLYSFKYDKCFASDLVHNFNVRMKVIDQNFDDNVMSETLSIYSNSPELIDKTIDYLNNYSCIDNNISVLEKNKNCVLIKISALKCPVMDIIRKKLVNNNNKMNLERIDYSGNIKLEMDVKSYNKIQQIDDTLRDKFDIESTSIKVSIGRHIDIKSEYILKEAYERGYFDVPKKIGLRELSSVLGIPQTTLDLLIRREIKQIIHENVK